MGPPLLFDHVLGDARNEAHQRFIHELEHHDAVEVIRLSRGDLARRRLRVTTDKGTDCAIALPRSERLFDGAVLLLDKSRAIVVRAEPEHWLIFRAADAASGLELGYLAGNMHWPVRFEGDRLHVAGGTDSQSVLERLHHLLDRGLVTLLGERA